MSISEYSSWSKEQLVERLHAIERERAEFEHALFSSVQELRDIRAAVDEHSLISITDATGRITYVNDRFCTVSGHPREELMGCDHRIVNSRQHTRAFFKDLWTTISSGRIWRGELRNRTKSGGTYWADVTIFPFMDGGGKPVQYVAIGTDVTQRREHEEDLQRFATELAHKNKELEAIVQTIANGLRPPLANVRELGAQLVRAQEQLKTELAAALGPKVIAASVTEDLPVALHGLNRSVDAMESLLSGVVRYSQVGHAPLTISAVGMNAMLATVMASLRPAIDAAGAEIRVEPLPDAYGDAQQIALVFSRVLENALEYRDPSRTPRILIGAQVEKDRAVYHVSDNGRGIPLAEQARIFDIFHRVDATGETGRGIGLTLVQRVLERQRGKIWLQSKEGAGSTFHISLPCG